MKHKFKDYLYKLLEINGSDLHFKSGSNVHMRIEGELHAIHADRLSQKDVEKIAQNVLTEFQYKSLVKNQEIDCAYELEKNKRFRVNFFYQVNGLSAVFRVIPQNILSLDELHIPSVVKTLADLNNGLVLVTGTSGAGKSTTMASFIDRINKTRRKHIISIEDPVEYLHKEEKCLISQRSVGTSTHSFASGLKSALREDIDIIFIGELRDIETVQIAMHAANTGHLVVSTLHTLDAKETISRILGMFPKEEQERVRMTLSFILEGIVSQRLVETVDGKRIPAVEVMLKTQRNSELIAENRDNEILESLEQGKEIYGTQTFDQSLLELYNNNKIAKSVALANATNTSDMNLKMQGIKQASGYETTKSLVKNNVKSSFELK